MGWSEGPLLETDLVLNCSIHLLYQYGPLGLLITCQNEDFSDF